MTGADELRRTIIETSLANGGHLASSLGAVELAMALADVFEPTKDRVVWDVGHQAYAWKLLTGRADRFSTLRKLDGVAPFPLPSESAADAAVAGHAGSALSVALGLAAARDCRGTDEQVVAVVGDSAMSNGHSLEALNNCQSATRKVILVLNDNAMSISRSVGALSGLLGRLLTNVRYNRMKSATERVGHRLGLTFLRKTYHKIESRIKGLFLASRFFEQFGLRYIGPVDGHDLAALRAALVVAKEDKRSVVVHVVTKKGKGYPPAEKDPTKYHGVSAGQVEGEGSSSLHLSWSDAFGEALCVAARADDRVFALTAGMRDGTGLAGFAREVPDRFRDVGIAEGHMVAFAAGLAAGGRRPVVAVYSTFLQRAVDQVMHDVCVANLPVVFCVDRAGVVGADGVTHQGLYDFAMLRSLPNLTICQPKDAEDLKALLDEALKRNGPTVIRYPRGAVPCGVDAVKSCGVEGLVAQPSQPLNSSTSQLRLSIWATGDQLEKANAVAAAFPGSEVVFARYLKPFDAELLKRQREAGRRIVSLENGAVAGGFGEAIGADFKFGWPDVFIPHGAVSELERRYRFDVDSIVATLQTSQTPQTLQTSQTS